MNIHEYQAKLLFQQFQIPVPQGKHAVTADSAKQLAQELGGEGWVVKAQVHAGEIGRAHV